MQKPLKPCKTFFCKNLVRNGFCYECIEKNKKKLRNLSKKESLSIITEGRLSSRQRGYDTRWEKFREWYLRKNPICKKCGQVAIIPHHIIPLPLGSKYDENNLMSVCQACHNIIHHRLKYN